MLRKASWAACFFLSSLERRCVVLVEGTLLVTEAEDDIEGSTVVVT